MNVSDEQILALSGRAAGDTVGLSDAEDRRRWSGTRP